MIPRLAHKTLNELKKRYPVVAITGPRQSGKTTLARHSFPDKPYVSLEDPDQLEFANEDPRGFLARFPDGALLDEVQRCPALLSYIQTNIDLDGRQGLFILTGSQQFGLLSKITQTLAGRVGLVPLLPFSTGELKNQKNTFNDLNELLFKGLYPPIYDRNIPPSNWYANYIVTYIERDVRQILNVKDLSTFQRFVRMCAARTGQLLNLVSLGNDCGISHNTAKAWLTVLEASYIVFLLYPHYNNFGKRLVKSPKIYFYDTGLAAWLLGIQNIDHLSIHPMRGSLFECLVIGELLKDRFNRGLPSNIFFWRDNLGTEIDVLIEEGNTLMPVEIKSGQTITRDYFTGLRKWRKITGSSEDPQYLVYGGDENQVRSGVNVLSWRSITDELAF
ncbi:MAG: ATP-binding protein [Syntrophales bacterium]|nr:ATP-binding protein [Syntrophales bacterium]